MSYMEALPLVAQADVEGLVEAEKSYSDSWKRRGGVGAFMMLARKWDRIERQVERKPEYDIFTHLENDTRPEGLIDDVRDLRRYLMLVEAELLSRQQVAPTRPDQVAPFGYEADED